MVTVLADILPRSVSGMPISSLVLVPIRPPKAIAPDNEAK
jgi:hypothetical protein